MNNNLTSGIMNTFELRAAIVASTLAIFSMAGIHDTHAADVASKQTAAKFQQGTARAPSQKTFDAPEALFQALADAAKAKDRKTLIALLGPSGEPLMHSGDAVSDQQHGERFASEYADKHSITTEGAKATLLVGKEDWPMPIPAVKGAHGWTLDSSAGAREILARRIGQNELDAIKIAQAIVDAEQDYSSEDRNADGLRDYAAKFISTTGKKDGLYWPTNANEPPSPLGPLVAFAAAEGYKRSKGAPFHGYHFRLLTAQGKDAPGGARNYLVHGRLLGGFAVVAYPALYGNSGIMTFIANQDGAVYEKDLGANTSALAQGMNAYNPDKSWTALK